MSDSKYPPKVSKPDKRIQELEAQLEKADEMASAVESHPKEGLYPSLWAIIADYRKARR